MTSTATHVVLRNGTYCYHRRVPQAVIAQPHAHQLHFQGQTFFRRSLRTKVYADALASASLAEKDFDQRVAAAFGQRQGHFVAAKPNNAPLNSTACADVAVRTRDVITASWRMNIIAANINGNAKDALEARFGQMEYVAHATGDPYAGYLAGETVSERARRLNDELGYRVAESSTAFAELMQAIKDGVKQAINDIEVMVAGKSLPDAPSSTLMNTSRQLTRRRRLLHGSQRSPANRIVSEGLP